MLTGKPCLCRGSQQAIGSCRFSEAIREAGMEAQAWRQILLHQKPFNHCCICCWCQIPTWKWAAHDWGSHRQVSRTSRPCLFSVSDKQWRMQCLLQTGGTVTFELRHIALTKTSVLAMLCIMQSMPEVEACVQKHKVRVPHRERRDIRRRLVAYLV